MKLIPFSGMLCHPHEIEKDGTVRIKGTLSKCKDMPPLIRYEYFACEVERDKRFEMLTKLLKE